MSLRFKKKIYLSLDEGLLKFVDEQASILNITKSSYIRKLLITKYEVHTQKVIDKIIEGK